MPARASTDRPLRILLATRGSAGHVLPLAPFGRACAAAGHEVTVAAQRQHRENIERTGLPFAAVDEPAPGDWMPLLGEFGGRSVDSAHAVQIAEFFGRLDLEAALPGLAAIAGDVRPDLIVRDSWEFASTIVGEERGVPVVRVGLGLAAVEEETIALAAGPVDRARARAGLPPDPAGERMRATPFLTMLPAALDDPAAPRPAVTHRFRAGPATAAGSLPDWWPGDARPLVHLTLGSVAPLSHLPYFPALYRDAVEALSSMPVRVLVTVGAARDPADLGAVPENVRVERWIDLDTVAARADVVVGHGGYGTTLGSLTRGVPLVVLPLFSGDQWANATAVARTGAGIALDDDRATRTVFGLPAPEVMDRLTDAVRKLLEDPAHRRAAGAIAEEIRGLPPVEDSVRILGEIAAAGT